MHVHPQSSEVGALVRKPLNPGVFDQRFLNRAVWVKGHKGVAAVVMAGRERSCTDATRRRLPRWRIPESSVTEDFVASVMVMGSRSKNPGCAAVRDAIAAAAKNPARVNLMPAFDALRRHADRLEESERLPIYEDVAVLSQEWDQFLRAATGAKNLAAFISSKALGATQYAARKGVALLTLHSSQWQEFDVVFMAGMADGVFPNYRATASKQRAEETRNAFVAATRPRRLLCLTYQASFNAVGRRAPQRPSPFLAGAER
ncbi:MAG TPA: 3'-5' exonuclease [Ramlibacter sp.]|jgi:DNA helicase-2/ATP-dependent DNA helicase PcrA|nr:3'-5' exonuclease [Ramlibacter sp.]